MEDVDVWVDYDGSTHIGYPSGRDEFVDVERLVLAARRLVLSSTPFPSAIELDGRQVADGEELHREMREALHISEDEWRESPDR